MKRAPWTVRLCFSFIPDVDGTYSMARTIGPAIGVIGGCGSIGRALVQGVLAHEIAGGEDVIVSGRAAALPDCPPGVRYTCDNSWLAAHSDVVIVSVRPEQFAAVSIDAQGCLLVSVMAGVPAAVLAERTKAVRVIRAMPNAAVSIGRSYTPFYANPAVCAEERQLIRRILDAVGKSAEVQSEAVLDYMSGLTGPGPAFVALLADAMLSHAITRGLDHDLAYEAIRATIEGAGEIVGRGDLGPREIIETLKAYRGTTATALEVMHAEGFSAAVAAGLEAAEARARTMYPAR